MGGQFGVKKGGQFGAKIHGQLPAESGDLFKRNFHTKEQNDVIIANLRDLAQAVCIGKNLEYCLVKATIIIPLLDKAIEEQKENGPYLGVFREMKTFLCALRDKAN